MPFWERWTQKKKEKDRPKQESGSQQAYVVFQDGSVLETPVGTAQDAASYPQIVEQIAQAQSMVKATEVVIRNMGTFDEGWWDYLDTLIGQMKEAGRQEFVRQGMNTGKFICDQVLIYGSMEQLLAASRWWNRYLIAEIVERMESVESQEKVEKAIGRALHADVEPSATYLELLEILSNLKEGSPYALMQQLTEANSNWLDQYFFEGLSRAIEQAERRGKKGLAWRCFAVGAVAGSTIFNHRSVTLLGRAKEFLDRFPEQRYAPRP